jgi:hypothetical protein
MATINPEELNIYTPMQGRAFLDGLGYTPDAWDTIVRQRNASHQVRALIHVAQGDGPQNLLKVYQELYPNEPAHWLKPRTEGDIEAEQASDAEWQKLSSV